MEFILTACIVLAIIGWFLRTFVLPVATVVQTVSNNNFVRDYVTNYNLQNAMHFVATIKEGNNAVNTNVIIADDGVHFPIPNGNHVVIPISKIQYFVREGDVSYTNQVYSAGRKLSLGKAIVGGIIAGPIGAVVGGVSGAEKLENSTVIHDDTETYIYYYVNDNSVALLSVYGSGFYQNLKLRFPYKELGYVNAMNANNNDTSDMYIENAEEKMISQNESFESDELPDL